MSGDTNYLFMYSRWTWINQTSLFVLRGEIVLVKTFGINAISRRDHKRLNHWCVMRIVWMMAVVNHSVRVVMF